MTFITSIGSMGLVCLPIRTFTIKINQIHVRQIYNRPMDAMGLQASVVSTYFSAASAPVSAAGWPSSGDVLSDVSQIV